MHVLVGVGHTFPAGHRSTICAAEHADGVDGGVCVLHVLAGGDGCVGNSAVEVAVMVGLAIGEHNNDLFLSVIGSAFDDVLGILHAIICAGCTASL